MAELRYPDPPLGDAVVRLRAPVDADLHAWWRTTQDPLVPRFTPVPAGQSVDDLRTDLARRESAREAGEALLLVIADRTTDEFLGTVSMSRLDWSDRRGEIGYLLGPWARGRGAATHAVRLLAHWSLNTLGLARLELYAETVNRPSQRVAERCGFVREGVLRSLEERHGRRRDYVLYSLLPSDPGTPV